LQRNRAALHRPYRLQALEFSLAAKRRRTARRRKSAANHSVLGNGRKLVRQDRGSVPVLPAEQILEKVQ